MASLLNAADEVRATSWNTEIPAAVLPGVAWRDEGNERRFLGHGGLLVSRINGAWCRLSDGFGHYSSVLLVHHIGGYTKLEASQWVMAFLTAHPGAGPCTGSPGDEDEGTAAECANRAIAEDIVMRLIAPEESEAVSRYLYSRALPPPYPDCVRAVRDARIGEDALVGVLTFRDRVVGVHLTYIAPSGSKSLIQPLYSMFMLEKAPGAVFHIPARSGGADAQPSL